MTAILELTGSILKALEAYRRAFALIVITASSIYLLPAFGDGMQGDVSHYHEVAKDFFSGIMPYRDRSFEYPPYALAIFVVPEVFGDADYLRNFMAITFFIDFLLKVLLYRIGIKVSTGLSSLIPVLFYCVTIPFLHYFLLQRYDLYPAFVCVLGLWLFGSCRTGFSGLCFAVGAGLKLYPMLFLTHLFLAAWKNGKGARFISGCLYGFLPLCLLSCALPWWLFAKFQGARGLQVESVYASFIWLAKLFGCTDANWVYNKAWFEVEGKVAFAVLPWSRLLFACIVILSIGLASVFAVRCFEKLSLPRAARILLVPLLAFVAFNQVLSPQYMVWILPIAAIGCMEGAITPMVLLIVAAVFTPVIFPSLYGDYCTGLNLLETFTLLLRNILLIVSWGMLCQESVAIICARRSSPITMS